MSFLNALEKAENLEETENGGVAYKEDELPDLVKWFYNISDNRAEIINNKKELEENREKRLSIVETKLVKDIVDKFFEKAQSGELEDSDRDLISRFILYIRDPREGLGERSLFRTLLSSMIKNNFLLPKKDNLEKFCEAIVSHGRWDDLISLRLSFDESGFALDINEFIKNQFNNDLENAKSGEPISLLAKWMPSINTSSKATRDFAKIFAKSFGLSEKDYRKNLSFLRNYLNVVERNVCQNTYENIDYSEVPSLAMTLYREKFTEKDGKRFSEFLNNVSSGKEKINSSTSNPVSIVSTYLNGKYESLKNNDKFVEDKVLEEQWKALPISSGSENYLPVLDRSGSMRASIGNFKSMDVSIGMGLYLSQFNNGIFKDKVLTFADKTSVVDFSDCKTLKDKLVKLSTYDDGMSTNVENVLDTILDLAVSGNALESEIPTLVFITDCEFNNINKSENSKLDTVFEACSKKFSEKGYKLPKIVFWNTQNRSRTVPMTQNENGLILLSGFSQNVVTMISEKNLDPLSALTDELYKSTWDDSEYLW